MHETDWRKTQDGPIEYTLLKSGGARIARVVGRRSLFLSTPINSTNKFKNKINERY